MKTVAVTGGSGQIAYSLLFRIANGELFGPDVPIHLAIKDLPEMQKALEGVAMELSDCAFPLLRKITLSAVSEEVFNEADTIFLVGAKPRGPGMERSELLKENGKIFQEEGRAIDKVASKNAIILVVGNPCNTNCLIALHQVKRLSKWQFHAMMRLDQNRTSSLIAKKAHVSVGDVEGVTIWGNHSSTQVPDFLNAKIQKRKVTEWIEDTNWLREELYSLVQKRGAAIIAARGKSSAASAAHAALLSMKDLYFPTPKGKWFTSGVYTEKNPYGIDNDLVFGFPCISKGEGHYEIVAGLHLDTFLKEKIALTQKELIEERQSVFELFKGK